MKGEIMSSTNLSDDCGWETVKKNKRKRNSNLPNKKRKTDLQNVPTAEELNKLKEAEAKFQSNLFKMQVEELIKELKEKTPKMDKLIQWLQILKDHLRNIPEDSLESIEDYSYENDVEIPIIQNPKHTKGNFKFIPPTEIKEIGSFTLETMCSAVPVIDIAVEIPKACWSGMDFLNQRYHRKRALYLSFIANSLLESDIIHNLKFKYQNECYLKPVLLIQPKDLEITVCLTAYPASNAFKLSRFLPSKNNVRFSWYFENTEDAEQSSMEPVATPYYNASILSDLLLPQLNEYLKSNINSQNVKEGLILLKLWCFQRGLTDGYGRLNGFILTMFVAYLLKKCKITPLMSAYQVFRSALLGFRNENWYEQGITLCDEVSSKEFEKDLEMETLQAYYNVVFVDSSGFFNLCYYVTKETFTVVQHEAKLGIQILDKESPESFDHLFMNKIIINRKFEYLLHLKGPKKFNKYLQKLLTKNELQKEKINFGENTIAPLFAKINGILKKGLNNRILLLDIIKSAVSPWSVNEAPPNPNSGEVIIGFLLDPDSPFSNIEMGPLADDHEAAKEFRKFWGDRSELRRFQDGTIREAVVWPAKTYAERRKVFPSVVADILKRHIKADPNHLVINGTEIDCVLSVPETVLSPDFPSYGTGEEAHLAVMKSFNSLSNELRGLNGLPLLISSVQGVSPSFRHSEVFPPLSVTHIGNSKNTFVSGHFLKLKESGVGVPSYTPALKAIVTLESSGKWPDDVEAIKMVKAEFHLEIARLVNSQLSLMTVPFVTHTDIFKDGFVFRIEVACHKEIFLLKQVKTSVGTLKIQDNAESRNLELSTEILPKLNSILHGLHQQHNSFGTACRLAKRWISAQLKHGFMLDIAVELLIASLYIHPEPYSCTCSPQVAFIRFLTLLVNHDWRTTPLIINLNNELTKEDIDEIYTTFTSQRSTLPPMVIPNPLDRRGSLWTKNKPPALILKRIKILAAASLKTLDGILSRAQISDIKAIFRPPLESYDVIIHLKRNEVPTLRCAVDVYTTDKLPVFKPYKYERNELYPIVEYDPVQKYLEELRENFGEFAFFLYDVYGGDFIAVVWKQSAFTPKEFKSSTVSYRKLSENGNLVPDIESILEDFEILGSGIKKKIVKKAENWQIP
ncbi:nucleolar protein 6 [Caerostris darwini]|uniref:Nucleolar protein 6 n=1 Tax=Caerostris darwini TaxID=1538125 RepID=A0AAV4RNP1_9ARAC|nr:nucleolar protein 6 [Caerostris darwini]